jgi:hypothetical protein
MNSQKNGVFSILVTVIIISVTSGFARSPVWTDLQFGLSGIYGISSAEVAGDGLLYKYFAPTSSLRPVVAKPFGIEAEVLFKNWIGLSLGLRYQKLGQNTAEQQVMFADDIFTHTFKSTSEISYIGVPALLKIGYAQERFWAFARAGAVGQLLYNSKSVWQIDGYEAYPGSVRMPSVNFHGSTSSYLLGLEAGIRWGRNGFFLMGDYLNGKSSFASDLSGNVYHKAGEIFIGYRRFFEVK